MGNTYNMTNQQIAEELASKTIADLVTIANMLPTGLKAFGYGLASHYRAIPTFIVRLQKFGIGVLSGLSTERKCISITCQGIWVSCCLP